MARSWFVLGMLVLSGCSRCSPPTPPAPASSTQLPSGTLPSQLRTPPGAGPLGLTWGMSPDDVSRTLKDQFARTSGQLNAAGSGGFDWHGDVSGRPTEHVMTVFCQNHFASLTVVFSNPTDPQPLRSRLQQFIDQMTEQLGPPTHFDWPDGGSEDPARAGNGSGASGDSDEEAVLKGRYRLGARWNLSADRFVLIGANPDPSSGSQPKVVHIVSASVAEDFYRLCKKGSSSPP